MMKRPLFIVITCAVLLIAFFCPPCQSQPQTATEERQEQKEKQAQANRHVKADFSELLKTSAVARVGMVIDPLTIYLKNKKVVRLTGIEIPAPPLVDEKEEIDKKAMELLKKLLPEGEQIEIYQTKNPKIGRVNRMDQMLAHVSAGRGSVWIQGELLARGLAVVRTGKRNQEMADQMLLAEAKARKEKRGIWSDKSKYPKILNPETAESGIGHFHIVEGTVKTVATVKNNVYLNFGSNWRNDFTVMITPALRKELSRKGIAPMMLAGRKVRVRGFIERYNGAMIKLNNPTHLEVIEDRDTRKMAEEQ